MSVQVLPVL